VIDLRAIGNVGPHDPVLPGKLYVLRWKEVRVRELESKHRDGYKRKPVKRGEFTDWESEHVWGD
jgi:hypothetical protein